MCHICIRKFTRNLLNVFNFKIVILQRGTEINIFYLSYLPFLKRNSYYLHGNNFFCLYAIYNTNFQNIHGAI